jgi:hypothetical protein
MADVEPRMDFRYRDEAGAELEAFKVTPAGRWDSEHWPAWLQTQSTVNDINKVYTDPSSPKQLFINLEAGRFAIEENAYIIFENGGIRVEAGDQFESRFTKVVPLPPRNLDEPSLEGFEETHRVEDGKLVALTPEEIEAKQLAKPPVPPKLAAVDDEYDYGVPVVSTSSLRPKAEIAFELLADGDVDAAKSVLAKALGDETNWCTCAPGQCSGGPRWGCRQNSPLVK